MMGYRSMGVVGMARKNDVSLAVEDPSMQNVKIEQGQSK
jgi:hypothetical protein